MYVTEVRWLMVALRVVKFNSMLTFLAIECVISTLQHNFKLLSPQSIHVTVSSPEYTHILPC